MVNPLPVPPGDGAYFTITLTGAEVGPDGITRGQGNGITLTATPMGLARLNALVRPPAISALMFFLAEGQVTLIDTHLRIEIEGWGREWLQDRGFSVNQARDAIRDLLEAALIRTEQRRADRGYLGRQVGVLAGSVYGSGDVYLAPERTHRPAGGNPASGDPGALVRNPARGTNPPAAQSPLVRKLDKGDPLTPAALGRIPASGQPAPTSQSFQEPQSFQDLITRTKPKDPIPAGLLLAALAAYRPHLAADPDRAVELLAGIFATERPEHPLATAAFLGLPATTPAEAARALAAHAVAALLDPAAAADIRALARAKAIALREPYASNPDLPAAWALGVLCAGTIAVADHRKYLYSMLTRDTWTPSQPLPRLAEQLRALTSPALGTALLTARPVAEDANLDQVLAVLAEHFDAIDADIHQWRHNPRLRANMIARFAVETGMTPEEMLRAEHRDALAHHPDHPEPAPADHAADGLRG